MLGEFGKFFVAGRSGDGGSTLPDLRGWNVSIDIVLMVQNSQTTTWEV